MMLAAVVIVGQMLGDTSIGGLIAELRAIDPALVDPQDSGPYGASRGSVFTILAYATLWAAVLPYMGMRFMAFRSDVKMRTVALYAAPMGVVLSLVPLVGLYVRARVGGLDDSDEAMPVYLTTFLHPAVGAVITLCILFAMKSTANSILHTVSSAVSHDLRQALFPHRTFSASATLWINRGAVAVLGVLALVLMLYAPPFLLSWLGILGTGTLLAATVAPVFVSVFWRGNAYGALASMLTGTLTSGGLLLFSGAGWMIGSAESRGGAARSRLAIGNVWRPLSTRAPCQYRKQRAVWPSPKSRAAGSSRRQRSMTCGQRGWKWQPLGGLAGDGRSPVSRMRSRRPASSTLGVAESSAWV